MKALLWKAYGTPEALKFGEAPVPRAGAGEVLIRIGATGLNAADLHLLGADPFPVRLFAGLTKPKFLALGADVAGTIEAVGPGVTRFQPGDRVFGDLSGCGWGGLAEFVCAPEAVLAAVPAGLSLEEAAAVPMAAVTALQALRDKGQIRPGMRVLVHGASGGVGTFSVQLAKAFGAEVTAVCSEGKADLVRSLGADRVIDYAKEDFAAGGPVYNLIHAANGDRKPADYRRALAPGGVLVVSGGSVGQLTRTLVQGPWLTGGGRRLVTMTAHPSTADLAVLTALIASGKLRPVLDRTYPLDRGTVALRYLAEGHAGGKVVVTVGG